MYTKMTANHEDLLSKLQKERRKLMLPPLLTRDFQPVENVTTSNSQPAIRIMQWNTLAQGRKKNPAN